MSSYIVKHLSVLPLGAGVVVVGASVGAGVVVTVSVVTAASQCCPVKPETHWQTYCVPVPLWKQVPPFWQSTPAQGISAANVDSSFPTGAVVTSHKVRA